MSVGNLEGGYTAVEYAVQTDAGIDLAFVDYIGDALHLSSSRSISSCHMLTGE